LERIGLEYGLIHLCSGQIKSVYHGLLGCIGCHVECGSPGERSDLEACSRLLRLKELGNNEQLAEAGS